MRAGKHYATLSLAELNDKWIHFGLVRPIKDWDRKGLANTPWQIYCFNGEKYQTQRWGTGDIHCCAYDSDDGDCYWSNWKGNRRTPWVSDWEGMENAQESSTIGLLLDFDNGTLSVYKNGRRLGMMKDGLSGEYCWMAILQPLDDPLDIEIKRELSLPEED